MLLALSLQGCFFGPSNAVRLTNLPKPGNTTNVTRLVYGLDASNGGLTLALARYDPTTGDAGNCGRYDHTEATSGTDGTSYFVFDVPPGAYVVSFFNTSGYVVDTDPAAFVAPAGKLVYVGEFSRSATPDLRPQISGPEGFGPIRVDRSGLEDAKTALGPAAASLEMAEVLPDVRRGNAFLCSL